MTAHESSADYTSTRLQESFTPRGVSIDVRKFDLADTENIPEYFFANDPFKTHLINSLSLLFPEGERFFIRSVLAYRDQISDPKLLQEIKDFCAQEAQHTLVHEALNNLPRQAGYPIDQWEAEIKEDLRGFSQWGKTNERAKLWALATTVCLEHFTAILAYQVLNHEDELLEGLDPTIRALLAWHAFEETEHKSVAFDVYKAVGGSNAFLKLVMLSTSFGFVVRSFVHLRYFLGHDGNIKKPSTWTSGYRFLLSRKHKGVFPRIAKDWVTFFKPDFHPWRQHRKLDLEAALEKFDAYLKPVS